jgi:hypothetical protein
VATFLDWTSARRRFQQRPPPILASPATETFTASGSTCLHRVKRKLVRTRLGDSPTCTFNLVLMEVQDPLRLPVRAGHNLALGQYWL